MATDNNIVISNNNGEYFAIVSAKKYKCSVGINGLTDDKREGDGKTPIGSFPLREIWVRDDKVEDNIITTKLITSGLPIYRITAYDGWCDESLNLAYNKHVDLRYFDNSISHEELLREDDLYDCVIVVGYNDDPVIPAKGSAIFIHIALDNYSGTAGCVAFSKEDLWEILLSINTNSQLIIRDVINSDPIFQAYATQTEVEEELALSLSISNTGE